LPVFDDVEQGNTPRVKFFVNQRPYDMAHVRKRGRGERLRSVEAFGGGQTWRFHENRSRNRVHKKVHFSGFKCLNRIVHTRSTSLMKKRIRKTQDLSEW